jgi:hypothetical protein
MFAKGMSTRSASIKPALLVETQHRFRESNYGFSSFREYLGAASRAGYVSLRDAEVGPDKDVLPVVPPAAVPDRLADRPLFSAAPGSGPATTDRWGDLSVLEPPPPVGVRAASDLVGSPAAATTTAGGDPTPGDGPPGADGAAPGREPSIRSDLWITFVDWSGGDARWFDRRSGFAFRLPRVVDPTDPVPVFLWSEAVRSEPDRFVPITPIDQERTLTWIAEFLQGLPPDAIRDSLIATLDLQQPIREFTARARALERSPQWTAFRVRRIRDYILAWAATNSLQFDVHKMPEVDPTTKPTPRPPQPRIDARPSPARPGTATGAEPRSPAGRHLSPDTEHRWPPGGSPGREGSGDFEALRRWVHELVDRMTVTELLSLPITPDLLWRR